MLFLSVAQNYLLWHYGRAFLEIFHVWFNLIWFTVHFFSIPQLMRSWVSPWKRMVEDKGRKWNVEDLAGYLIIGLLSRLIGFILRTIVIGLGLISLLAVVVAGFSIYVIWISLPLVIIALFIFGITLIIS